MKKKLFALIGIAFVCMAAFTGCTKQSPYFHTKKEIRNYLKQKYDKDFVVKDYSRDWFSSAGMNIGWDEGVDTYTAYPKDDPDLIFTGSAGSNDIITDEYVIRSICDEIKDIVSENTGELVAVYPESPYYVPPEMNSIFLSDYLATEDTKFNIYIFLENLSLAETMQTALSGITGLNGNISIYQTDKLDIVKDYTSKSDLLYASFWEEIGDNPAAVAEVHNSSYYLQF